MGLLGFPTLGESMDHWITEESSVRTNKLLKTGIKAAKVGKNPSFPRSIGVNYSYITTTLQGPTPPLNYLSVVSNGMLFAGIYKNFYLSF